MNKRYEAYNWHVETVTDANDLEQLQAALNRAKLETSKPSLIKVNSSNIICYKGGIFSNENGQIRTCIGYGSPKQGSEKVHGAPLGAADLKAVKTFFNFDPLQVKRECNIHLST